MENEGGIFSKITNFFEKTFKINISKPRINKEIYESFEELCINKGYGVNEYTVKTEDNYKLRLYRIINKQKNIDEQNNQQAVYFQHGLFDSSDGWVCNYEKNCLPYILVNKGFDVWIGNSRGNKHSKFIEQFENENDDRTKDASYWDYSFHEMGMYDLPANLDKILSENTTTKKIIYFGHSQGGASVLVGMTEKIEYFKERLKIVILLAPASRVDNYKSSLLTLIKEIDLDGKLRERNIHEVLFYHPDLNNLNIHIGRMYPTMHYAMLELTSDEASWINCPDRIKVYLSHYPSGSSVKSLTHFKQVINAKAFQNFDYGVEENMRRYNTPYPKPYDLSKIKEIPIILTGGLNDRLTHIEDIRWLKGEISQTLYSYYEFEHMGHASFLINNDITWFNYILRDIYKLIENDLSFYKEKIQKSEIPQK